jgi:hypothetical protein
MAKVSGGGMTNARALQVSSCPPVLRVLFVSASFAQTCHTYVLLVLVGTFSHFPGSLAGVHFLQAAINAFPLSYMATPPISAVR